MIERLSPFRRPSRKTVFPLAGLAACALLAGCAADSPAPANEMIQVQLTFGSGVTLDNVNYRLTGPNAFLRVGTLPVGTQSTITATFQNLPVGQGYDLMVEGSASDDATACNGEVMFNVAPSMAATLQIPLICQGLASVTANVNVCPVIDSLSAIPAEVYVGNSIQVTSMVHDTDGGPAALSTTWSASGGSLSGQSATGATFTCTAPGTFTINLNASDGDTSNMCPSSVTITVVCTP